MSDLDQEIGKRLREARKLRGYKSARAFAIEKNIPESTYSQHETGKRSLNPNTLLNYCEHLGIEPGWLLTGRHVSVELCKNGAVPEATLRASHRQPARVASDQLSLSVDSFKDILKSSISKFSENNNIDIDALFEYCLGVYSRSIQQTSSDVERQEA